mmetsp:Transcript_95059/g.277969  ORF Transcript_95059/g.277969 Transcript_95059/m.277969 type:complete len:325 (+) Transcript_95059:122-1096(+)
MGAGRPHLSLWQHAHGSWLGAAEALAHRPREFRRPRGEILPAEVVARGLRGLHLGAGRQHGGHGDDPSDRAQLPGIVDAGLQCGLRPPHPRRVPQLRPGGRGPRPRGGHGRGRLQRPPARGQRADGRRPDAGGALPQPSRGGAHRLLPGPDLHFAILGQEAARGGGGGGEPWGEADALAAVLGHDGGSLGGLHCTTVQVHRGDHRGGGFWDRDEFPTMVLLGDLRDCGSRLLVRSNGAALPELSSAEWRGHLRYSGVSDAGDDGAAHHWGRVLPGVQRLPIWLQCHWLWARSASDASLRGGHGEGAGRPLQEPRRGGGGGGRIF